jgi:hypothetical protein
MRYPSQGVKHLTVVSCITFDAQCISHQMKHMFPNFSNGGTGNKVHTQEHATRITAMLLQDLIQEAQEANEKLWELVRPLVKQQDGEEPTRH